MQTNLSALYNTQKARYKRHIKNPFAVLPESHKDGFPNFPEEFVPKQSAIHASFTQDNLVHLDDLKRELKATKSHTMLRTAIDV